MEQSGFLDRIHWPQAFVLGMTILGFFSTPVIALVLVPEKNWIALAGLPWTTIISVGTPALVALIGAVAGALGRPVITPRVRLQASDEKTAASGEVSQADKP